jgi:hypothetical protein
MRHFANGTERKAFLEGLAEAEEICINSLHNQAAALIRVVASVQRKSWGLDNGVTATSGARIWMHSEAPEYSWLTPELIGRLVMADCVVNSRVEYAMKLFRTKKDFMEADPDSFIKLPNCGKRTAGELQMIQGVLIKDFKVEVAF